MKLKTIAGLTALILLSEPAYQGIRNSINSYISENKTETSFNLEQNINGLYAAAKKQEEKQAEYVELNDSNYKKEVLDYEGNCIVLFYDSNKTRSPPSARMKKVLDELIKEYEGKIKFGKYDAETYSMDNAKKNAKKMKDRYEVEIYPSTIFVKNGKPLYTLRGGPKENGEEGMIKWFKETIKYYYKI